MTDTMPRTAAAPVVGSRNASTRRRRGRGARVGRPGPLVYVFLVGVLLVSAFPLYWMFVVASNTNAVMAQLPPRVTPGPNTVSNIERALDSLPFARALMNSFIVAGTVTVSVLFFCTLAGFAFAKLRFRGREPLLAFVVATMMVPQQLGLIPLYMLMARFGWVNHLRAAMVPTLVTAFGVFWMRQYLSGSLHDELLEAGRVDGCTTFGLFRHIVVPAAKPAAGVLGLITFATAWNDFLWPLVVLQDQSKHTVQVALQQLNNAYIQDYSLVMAGTLMAIAPLLVMFALFSRQMVAGVMEGSVKS